MARRTIDEQLTSLENERDRLETKLAEIEAYRSISAQGEAGSESQFTDISKIHARLAAIYNSLETLYRNQGV